jgi:hypothetical protein
MKVLAPEQLGSAWMRSRAAAAAARLREGREARLVLEGFEIKNTLGFQTAMAIMHHLGRPDGYVLL